MNEIERNAIVNSIKFIIDDLGEDELETRTGFSIKRYEDLCELISQKCYEAELGADRQIMLHQALNEVGHGVNIPQFEMRIGMTLLAVKKMLNYMDEKLNLG